MKQSAGTLLYRDGPAGLEVLLVHPSGNYNRHKPWSIPKGEPDANEDLESTARRETLEETGVVAGELISLGSIQYTKSKKTVHAYAGPAPDDAAPRALEHLDQRAQRPAARVAPGHAHGRAVAVHDFAHVRLREQHRRPAHVGHEEAMAVGMALDASRDERDAFRDEQRAGAVLHHLARALERGKRLLERRPLALLDLEALRQLIARERRARAVHRLENLALVIRARRRRPLCAVTAPERCFSCLFL